MSKDNGLSLGLVRRFAGRIGLSLAILTGGVVEVGQTADSIRAGNLQKVRDIASEQVESTLSLTSAGFKQNREKVSNDLSNLSEDMAYLTEQFSSHEQ